MFANMQSTTASNSATQIVTVVFSHSSLSSGCGSVSFGHHLSHLPRASPRTHVFKASALEPHSAAIFV